MSGILAMLHTDDQPVDVSLLNRLTDRLAFRGPDGAFAWHDHNIGLGHALLRVYPDERYDRQPCTLDGHTWITAQARIDARADLAAALGGNGAAAATDAELILRAYDAWGIDCVHHLIGDFAFVLWDSREQRLLVATDHFAVRPIYYSARDGRLLISNTMSCLRAHPAVRDVLDDASVGDFLVAGEVLEPPATIFADIRRLPPAHRLIADHRGVRVDAYWKLPADGCLRYRDPREYVEHFRGVFEQAVADRVRSGPAGVLLSGGVDSTSVAAMARRQLPATSSRNAIRACTVYLASIPADQEPHFAGIAARHLGIPLHLFALDAYRLYEGWDRPELRIPFPGNGASAAANADSLRLLADHARLVLTGQGGDTLLMPEPLHFPQRLRRGELHEFAVDVLRFTRTFRKRPPLGLNVLQRYLRGRGAKPFLPPPRARPDLVARFRLNTRWKEVMAASSHVHRLRQVAGRLYYSSFWRGVLAHHDPEWTGLPIEAAHPFFDVRLAELLFAFPPVPWFYDKWILREAMRGLLPDEVRTRPKTSYPIDPVLDQLQRFGADWRHLGDAPRIADYLELNPEELHVASGLPEADYAGLRNLTGVSLAFWLSRTLGQHAAGAMR